MKDYDPFPVVTDSSTDYFTPDVKSLGFILGTLVACEGSMAELSTTYPVIRVIHQ
ncbi:unnamed protein product [Timema podura]|uniref:Uncharacterized protein n=1 Tax=Timema podura TaxID=61482 RepID=A0ABN7PJ96_TIMPD|nr:unnamed protein product [Timema podura]